MKQNMYFQRLAMSFFSSILIACGGSATDYDGETSVTHTASERDNYGYIVNLPVIKATSSESFSINWKVAEDNKNCEADVLMMSKSYSAEDSLSNQTVLNGVEIGDYSMNCYRSSNQETPPNYKCEGLLSSPTGGNIVKSYQIYHDRNSTYYVRLANQTDSNGIDYGDVFYNLEYDKEGGVIITKHPD